MKGKRKLKLREKTTGELKKRLNQLLSRWKNRRTNEIRYVEFLLRKRGAA